MQASVSECVSTRETKLARLTLDVARPRPTTKGDGGGEGVMPVGASGNRSRLLQNSSSNSSEIILKILCKRKRELQSNSLCCASDGEDTDW